MPLLSGLFWPAAVGAASAEAFAAAVDRAISPDKIAHGGTVPAHAPLTYGNRVEALTDGTAATLSLLCRQIEAAEHEILLQVYQWHDEDASAMAVVEALRRRIERAWQMPAGATALRIHIVVNGTWPAETTTSQRALLAVIEQVSAAVGAAERVQIELSLFGGFGLAVLHSKLAVTDGRTALLMTGNLLTRGGLDSDFYNAGMQVAGPMVAVLRDDFRDAHARSRVKACSTSVIGLPASLPPGDVAAPSGVPAAVLTKQASWLPITYDVNPQDRALLALIETTTHDIRAMNPALNAAAIAEALTAAALRGVDIYLVLSLNMDRWEQHTFFGGDNAEVVYGMYRDLLKQGGPAAARRLHVHWPSSDGQRPAPDGDAVNVHAKTAMFDAGCLWFGSMNWDFRSWVTSRELSVAMMGDFAQAWHMQLFDGVWQRSVAIRASDLPTWAQHAGDSVFEYLRDW